MTGKTIDDSLGEKSPKEGIAGLYLKQNNIDYDSCSAVQVDKDIRVIYEYKGKTFRKEITPLEIADLLANEMSRIRKNVLCVE